jgi:hypothetical protein
MKKLIVPGQPRAAERAALLDVDPARVEKLASRQMLIRPDHKGFAEFPIDPSRPDLTIGGSVVAFNPEAKHDEAVGLRLVSVGPDETRSGLVPLQGEAGLDVHLEDGQPFGMYLFTPTPNTASAATRISEVCYDGGRMVQVRGVRRRSLVCAVRFGERPIASDLTSELPVPLMTQRHGFPRTYLQSAKRQTPGIMIPTASGFEQRVSTESEPLVFGGNVPDGTPLTVAVLEYLEHEELETGPVDLRPDISALLSGTVDLQPRPIEPLKIETLRRSQKRLVTAMRVMLRKAAEPVSE